MDIGGEKAIKVDTRFKDVNLAYHYINGEAAMAVFPKRPRHGAGAYVVCESAAYKYYQSTQSLLLGAQNAIHVMGMDNTSMTAHNVATAIFDGLEYLIEMPPCPENMKERGTGEVIGEAVLNINGQDMLGKEIRA